MSLSRDSVTGILLLVICALLWYATTTFDSDPMGMTTGMPATEMPRLVIGVIAMLSLALTVQGLSPKNKTRFGAVAWQVPVTAIILGAIAVLLSTIGLPLGFFIVCTVIPILWGSRRYVAIVLFALATPIAIYVIFQLLLSVRLPLGPLAALGL
ncbi:tripartite tricarboxylate transporter TctB family protein [Thioclava nitratireducens]|uniref:DUF1468 domain-containing protein n=1 Tax=Thioclava nitratireducens TaxID=1915078 RepID=A0ABN4XDB6_9RHOB|nr:tripartite tricarboxylate transporter TctB family protein [Thioclava nitratireducens]AQS50135.1 hypothetical protein BMG03_19690 [Thioclava nitratireducens]WGT52593.1 tripartite tricarboxylate transporter TctB family protein [Thioclava nitratireducens]